MNISIKNLGPIGEADLVLKPLTLFIGPNNSGKSWIAYVLAGIFGSYGWQRYLKGYLDGQTQVSYPPLEQAFQQLLNEGNAKIDMVQFADTCVQDYFNDVARLARQWMQEFMGTERVSFADLEITVEPGERKEWLLQQARSFAVEFKLSVGQRKETALLNASKATDDPACYFTQLPERMSRKSCQIGLSKSLSLALFSVCCTRCSTPTFIFFPQIEQRLSPIGPNLSLRMNWQRPERQYKKKNHGD